jgi:hypothetical protein
MHLVVWGYLMLRYCPDNQMKLKKRVANIPKSAIFLVIFVNGFSIRAFFFIYPQPLLLAVCHSLWVRVIKKAQVTAGSSIDRIFYLFSTYPECRLHLVVCSLQDILTKIDGV